MKRKTALALWVGGILLLPLGAAVGPAWAAPLAAVDPASTVEVDDHTGVPGLGALDGWVDIHGDTMQGTLTMGNEPIQFSNGALTGDSGGPGLRFAGQQVCLAASVVPGCAGGDITGVAAGLGLLGGGSSGDVALDVNTGVIQRRVSGICSSGFSIRAIDDLGAVTCEADDDTLYTAGAGLALAGTAFGIATGAVTSAMVADGTLTAADVNAASIQRRVTGTCAAGTFLLGVNSDGTVSCGADADTTYSASSPLSLSGTAFGFATTGCVAGEVWKFTGTGWSCDPDATGAGTVTSVASGTGLTGGPITGSGTLSVATGGITTALLANDAVTSAKIANDAVTSAKIADGTITQGDLAFVPGDVTGVSAGTGLSGGGSSGDLTLSVNTSVIQNRVAGTCAAGTFLLGVNSDGTVSCGADADTTYTASAPLSLAGTSFGFATTGCVAGEVWKFTGAAWSCDPDATGAGTVTSVASGTGLTGGPITGSGTLSVATGGITTALLADDAVTSAKIADGTITQGDLAFVPGDVTGVSAGTGLSGGGSSGDLTLSVNTSVIQNRVAGTCAAGSAFRSIDAAGAVTCGSDAGTLDSIDSASFLRSDTSDTFTSGTLTFAPGTTLTVNGDLYLGGDSGADNDALFFDSNQGESLQWDDGESRFEFSDALLLRGALAVDASLSPLTRNYNSMASDANPSPMSAAMTSPGDLWVQHDLEVGSQMYLNSSLYLDGGGPDGDQSIFFLDGGSQEGQHLRWVDAASRFQLSSDLLLGGGGLNDDDVLYFDGASENLIWDDSAGAFHLSDSLNLTAIHSGPGLTLQVGADANVHFMADDNNNALGNLFGFYHNGSFLNANKLAELRDDGNLRLRGTVTQNVAFDVAEAYLAGETVRPGQLVRVDPARPDGVVLSWGAGDAGVLGVVSTDPGFLLGGAAFDPQGLRQVWGEEVYQRYLAEAPGLLAEVLAERPDLAVDPEAAEQAALERFHEAHFAYVALSGRAPVRVDASFGAVRAGDLLAPSPVPGVARKALDAGPVIGTALEDLVEGEGQVTTFLHRGWYTPDLSSRMTELEAENARLTARLAQLEQEGVDAEQALQDRLDRLEAMLQQLLEERGDGTA